MKNTKVQLNEDDFKNECGNDCSCNHHHNHKDEYMTLILDNNEEVKCSVVNIFDVEDREYIALLPVGEEEVFLYQYIEIDEDNFELKNIETEKEFETVQEVFFGLFEDNVLEDDDYENEYESISIVYNGKEVKCYIISIFNLNNKEFIALLPSNEKHPIFYEYIRNGETEFKLEDIKDTELLEEVEKRFFEDFDEKNEENFEEECF